MASAAIPASVASIRDRAFDWCRNLPFIRLDHVQAIGNGAFAYCALSFTTVEVGWAVPPDIAIDTYNKHVFPGTYLSRITFIVPVGAREYYRAARGWADFGRIMENVPITIHVTGGEPSHPA
ncbi:hypothetical protein FACS189435_4550 [Bacteroidia bacterium]|nr:hypothetical protein FACS189435_4550 [Bacteroidia bacterium]